MKRHTTVHQPHHRSGGASAPIETVFGLMVVVALLLAGALQAQTPRTATATATVVNGFVVVYTVTDGGWGYTIPPTVVVAGGGGSGATAMADVVDGVVTAINPVSPGSGYTSAPDVIVSAPPSQPTFLDVRMVPLLTILGTPGDTNRIEYVNAFGDTNVWIPLTNVVLPGSVLEWYDRISPPGSYRFYRTVLLGGTHIDPGERFVWLPAGQFVMGSPEDEQDRNNDEGPQTVVTLNRGFYMSRYEVTQAEYNAVMGSHLSGFEGDPNRPVEMVKWQDATNYCGKLTVQERAAGRLPAGWEYRLPTEAQWEYACRAGTTNRFGFGNDPEYTHIGDYAWYTDNSKNITHPVGSKLPNRWGLYDMHGNVWEWCADWYADSYPGGSVTNPAGPASGQDLVARGGSWYFNGPYCRSAYRGRYNPGSHNNDLGFRVALVAVP